MKNLTSAKKKIVFSFFAGAGFLDLGFETSGFEIVFVNELNKAFLDAYKFSRAKMGMPEPNFGYYDGDISDLTKGAGRKKITSILDSVKKKDSIIGFIGGPPCPDFSVAGKNRGRKGLHGKLSATYIKLICQQKPDFFLFENVKGLWKTKTHRKYYEELKKKLKRNGYKLTERLVNALEYGVPQDRERIILIGFRKNIIHTYSSESKKKSALKTLPFPWIDFIKYPREEIFKKYKEVESIYQKPNAIKPSNIPNETMVEYWFRKNHVSTHANAKHCFRPRQALHRFQTIKEGDVSRKSFKRLHRWRYSPTVAYGNNEVHLHPYKNRRLSVAEALAIQSLPESYIFSDKMTLSEMFKTISNGVPYVVAKGVAKSIYKFLDS